MWQRKNLCTGEMVQWLRAFAAVAEDQGFVPRTPLKWLSTTCNYSRWRFDALFCPLRKHTHTRGGGEGGEEKGGKRRGRPGGKWRWRKRENENYFNSFLFFSLKEKILISKKQCKKISLGESLHLTALLLVNFYEMPFLFC